jgi:hypothetical protein
MFLLSFRVAANGLALGEEADFETQNCKPALNLIRSIKLHLSTQTRFFAKRLLAVRCSFNSPLQVVKEC